MEYEFLIRLSILTTVLTISACIEQVDFDTTELQPELVVYGAITEGSGPHSIQISTTGMLGETAFPAVEDATVVLFDEAGTRYHYSHLGGGQYAIPAGILRANTGDEYFVEIFHGNKTYRSQPERIPNPQRIENLSYRLEEDLFILEAEITLPDVEEVYLKWNLENFYSITELICHPFISPKRCYILDDLHLESVPLLDASVLEKGTTFLYDIASKRINFTFGNPQSFYATQQSITSEAYEYWSRIDQVSNQQGTLFDPSPSRVFGNLSNIEDPSDRILGYFGAIAQDSRVLFVDAGLFFDDFQKLPYCGIPGFEIFDVGCCNCLELENSSITKPDYW